MKYLSRTELLIPIGYLLIVSVCVYFAFPMTTGNTDWFFALMTLTMPWSVVTFFLILGAIHLGDGDGAGLFFISISAGINAFLLYLLIRPKKKLNGKDQSG